MHGYQMISELAERTGGAWTPSPGAIYPALQLLADERLIADEALGPDDAPGRLSVSLTQALAESWLPGELPRRTHPGPGYP
mgnify:CR=1 FL=1